MPEDLVQAPEEVIMDIWFVLISCLWGKLDEVCNHSNDVATIRLRFLAEMAEHAYGEPRKKWREVELPAPTMVVSFSHATLPSL